MSAQLRLGAARTLTQASGGARKLAGRADRANGAAHRAAPVARQAAQRLDSMAGYLRSREGQQIVRDLEHAIHRHPLRALAIAFLVGYVTRRIL